MTTATRIADFEIRSKGTWGRLEVYLRELEVWFPRFEYELRLGRAFSFRECETVPTIEIWARPRVA